MKTQIILLGAPGSGKGTQAACIVEKFAYKHVSTGDLLRAEIAKKSSLGQRLAGIIEQGKLVDDATVFELLAANCDLKKGHYIFDGFPRTINQAHDLENKILKGAKTVAIYMEVGLDELVTRICNRRVAPKSGQIYNVVTKPPKKSGICDVSGEPLIQRKDDTEEVVRNRFDVFKSTIGPIIDYYEKKGILKRIDASINPDTSFKQICDLIEKT
ncbi:MAG: nucleoside monophosphate kinase [Pseudomonadota bacterium]